MSPKRNFRDILVCLLVLILLTYGVNAQNVNFKGPPGYVIASPEQDRIIDKYRPLGLRLNHPRNYVSLYEYTHDNRKLVIFSNDTCNDTCHKDQDERIYDNSVHYEIDISSKLVIKFDREWIYQKKDSVDLNISVRANLGQTPLPVPGYSRVGESQRLARFSQQSLGLFKALVDLNSEVRKLLINFGYDSLIYNSSKVELDTCPIFFSDSTKKFNEKYKSFIESPSEPLFTELVYFTDRRNNRIRKFLLLWEDIGYPIRVIHMEEFKWYIPIMATLFENHPELICNSAKVISDDYLTRLKDLNKEFKTLEQNELLVWKDDDTGRKNAARLKRIFDEEETVLLLIQTSLRNLLGLYKNWTYIYPLGHIGEIAFTNIIKLTLGLLKDTEIIISRTPARVNDTLDIDILNGTDSSDVQQVFPIRLVVKRFGWKPSLVESFMFFKRLGVSSSNKIKTASAAEAEVEEPLPVNYELYPGLSMIWTFHSRTSKFWRTLDPGIGFNVSFPRFGTSISNYEIDPVDGGSVTTTSEGEIGLSFGPVVSFFDGALQVSFGWMLSKVESKREYFAIGFSFLKVAKGD